jgi:F-type H+-transporting ATPase subunit b
MHIDWWTLALQTVNVLVLIWILSRFFFRPLANIVAKRQGETNKRLADAENERKIAADERAQAEKARAEASALHEKFLAEAQKTAHAEKTKLLDQATRDIAKLRADSEAALARDRAAAEQQVIDHACSLSVDIARHLLERLPPEIANDVFLAGLYRAIAELAPDARKDFAAAATTGEPIEFITAAPLSGPQVNRVRDEIKKAFGVELPLHFQSDAGLLSGVEMHGHNVILRNSWRADLGRVREELSREQHSGKS